MDGKERRMYRKYGQIFAPAISAFPPSVVVVCLKEPGKDNCSCIIFISYILVGNGGETIPYFIC